MSTAVPEFIARQITRMLVAKLKIHPKNARKRRPESTIVAMSGSLAADGQHYPLIGTSDGAGGALIIDGGTRLLGAQYGGLAELDVILLDHEPSEAELLLIQATADIRHEHLLPTERFRLWSDYQSVSGCSITELAAKLNVSQPQITKVFAVGTTAPGVQAMLDAGELSLEKAYLLSQEPDHAKQLELARQATNLSREQLREKVRPASGRKAEPKLSSARLQMPGGYSVTLGGPDLDLSNVCDVLGETLRIIKKGLAQGLSLASQAKVMKDTAKRGAK